jgi:hypothetical protein
MDCDWRKRSVTMRPLYTCLIACAWLTTNSCSSRPPEIKRSSPTAGVEKTSVSPEASLTAPQNETQEYPGVTVVHFPDEPSAFLGVEVFRAPNPRNSRFTLTIENISGKTVKLVRYGLGVPLPDLCPEYMYAAVPTPDMGYGDWSVAGIRMNTAREEPPLKPHERATITVSKNEYLEKLLNPKTYRRCEEGHKKPELMIQEAYFEDGTAWAPSLQRFVE